MSEQEALRILKGPDPHLAGLAEAALWKLWCRSGMPEVDALFRKGVNAIERRSLKEAEDAFTEIIEAAPHFTEGWNKRATVRYLAHNFSGAIADCRETLARNHNHFGALSGQGLCHLALGQYHEAAHCFRDALAVHPHLRSALHNLKLAQSEAGKANGKAV